MTTVTLLSIGVTLFSIGVIFTNATVRKLIRRLDRMEAIVADARPDLLALPPKPVAAPEPGRKKCGYANCVNYVNPRCPVLSCMKHCRSDCYHIHD